MGMVGTLALKQCSLPGKTNEPQQQQSKRNANSRRAKTKSDPSAPLSSDTNSKGPGVLGKRGLLAQAQRSCNHLGKVMRMEVRLSVVEVRS